MNPSTLVLLSVPLLALGPQIRNLRPRERLGEVPTEVSQVRDRQAIGTFIGERTRHEAAFLKRAMSACALLLDNKLTADEFAANLDVADARMDMDVERAYASLITGLTPLGKSELDTALAQLTGQASEEFSVAMLAKQYEKVSQLHRLFSANYRHKAIPDTPPSDRRPAGPSVLP